MVKRLVAAEDLGKAVFVIITEGGIAPPLEQREWLSPPSYTSDPEVDFINYRQSITNHPDQALLCYQWISDRSRILARAHNTHRWIDREWITEDDLAI